MHAGQMPFVDGPEIAQHRHIRVRDTLENASIYNNIYRLPTWNSSAITLGQESLPTIPQD